MRSLNRGDSAPIVILVFLNLTSSLVSLLGLLQTFLQADVRDDGQQETPPHFGCLIIASDCFKFRNPSS